jgi:hypothetical protein
MKRFTSIVIILLLILSMTGCINRTKYIKADDVTESTMLARANGELQVASIEKFDKNYYSLSELNDFIGKEVAAYNDKVGAENVKIDKIDERDINGSKNAVMLLTYASMKDYAEFNKVVAAYFHGGAADVTIELPSKLISAKNGESAKTNDVIKNADYKVLVVTEPLHIVVDGKVKFYSDKAKKIDKNEVKASAEGTTVVVFKH